MPDIQLYYFDFRGKAELIRLLLTAAGEKFEDIRISGLGDEWRKDAPFGQLPCMKYNGRTYGQSIAIANFLARNLGYCGKTAEDDLRMDEVVLLADDLRMLHIRNLAIEKDTSKKAEIAQKLQEQSFPRFLHYFEKLLEDNGSTGFFVGNTVSLADFSVYDALDTVLSLNPEALTSFPCQQTLRSNVEALPGIKEYLATRPNSVV